MLDKGYGVDLGACKLRKDAALILMNDRYAVENDNVLHEFTVFCDNYGYHTDDDEAKREFVDMYGDESSGCCMEGLIARFINDREFDGADYFVGRDGCLYVLATIPVDDEDRQAMPTQKEIQSLLAKYLNPLLEEPATIDWLEVSD